MKCQLSIGSKVSFVSNGFDLSATLLEGGFVLVTGGSDGDVEIFIDDFINEFSDSGRIEWDC